MGKAIILTDGKAGHENQSKAFARALGLDFVLVPVKFKCSLCKLLSYVLDKLGVHTARLWDFVSVPVEPSMVEPDHGGVEIKWVIGTGSGTFYPAKSLARGVPGAKCGVVLYPRGYDLSSFDCILAPTFDNPAKRANVVEIPANLVANDAAFYENGVAAFRERYSGAADNLVGVPNGRRRGSTRSSRRMPERSSASPLRGERRRRSRRWSTRIRGPTSSSTPGTISIQSPRSCSSRSGSM